MPEGIIAEVDEGFATIDFVDRSLRGPGLAKLIEIGGGESIDTLTRSGPRRQYRVPEGNAREAGLLDDPADAAPAPEPVVLPEGEPNEDWKFDQLKAYAADHDVDTDGMRSKAEVLAAIQGAGDPS
ncbi:hypothetical protein SEA_MARIOKART_13 [Gordonia phage Mariokart]|nr:hypothetical protein SEA_MARIOKART_13 [Gordonia phage Mariokart]